MSSWELVDITGMSTESDVLKNIWSFPRSPSSDALLAPCYAQITGHTYRVTETVARLPGCCLYLHCLDRFLSVNAKLTA